MPPAQLGTALRHVCRLLGVEPLPGLTDAQLVERFLKHRDETAFAALVRRHGRLVWSVCWQLLRQEQDAEDAFQATFLVLSRKAGSLRRGQSVASWLYRVAYRTAVRAAMNKTNQRRHERKAEEARQTEPHAELAWRELQAVLQDELEQLADRYRAPFVLCCLEGKSKSEAAAQLGWKEGTVSSRLAQARRLLRQLLARRGIDLSAVLCALTLTGDATAKTVACALADATAQAAVRFVTSKASLTGLARVSAAALAEGVLKTMSAPKIKLAVVCMIATGLMAAAASVAGHPLAGQQSIVTSSVGPSEQAPPGPGPTKPSEPPGANKGWARKAGGEVLGDLFTDVTLESGIDFTYRNGNEAGQFAILESLGGGVALIDYDGDGLLDIFFTGGGTFFGKDRKEIKGHPCKLYRNLGNSKFKDVTAEVGLDRIDFYTHGSAVVDFDNDGWPDLLVTGWHGLALFHNESDGKGGRRFVDVSRKAGLPQNLWTTSAAWADFDGDGWPDLFVCQYVNWDPVKNNPRCTEDGATPAVCPPKLFNGLQHRLFRNNGDGTFTDVTAEAGLKEGGPDSGKGLGVVVADVDGDGKPDIFVANDTVDKFLYINRCRPGKFLFQEQAMMAGVARDDRGVPNASKGVDAADLDGTGRPWLWCTNHDHELHGLYRNVSGPGAAGFRFATPTAGLAAIGQRYAGWGTGFLDLDNDGQLDLVIINGPLHFPAGFTTGAPPLLLRNEAGRFVDISRQSGIYFRSAHAGRGLAIGDLNNDGRPDLVISHLNEPVAILRNDADSGNHWVGVELKAKGNRDLVGAVVVVEAGEKRLTRFVTGGGSYLSSGDRRLLFGLGQQERIDRITVTWPGGHEQKWERLKADRYLRLVEAD